MKRLKEDLHRYRLLLPCALAAVMLLRWAVMRGRPERVLQLPLGPQSQWLGVQGGHAYTFGVSSNHTDVIAYSRAVDGEGERLLVRHPVGESDVFGFLSGDSLYFANVQYRDPDGSAAGQSRFGMLLNAKPDSPSPSRGDLTGADRSAGASLMAFGGRARIADRARTTLFRVRLSDGHEEKVHLEPGRPDPVFAHLNVVGKTIFWSRRSDLSPQESARYRGKKADGLPPPARYDLMASPVDGGPAVCILSDVFQFARMFATDEGVYWRVVRPHEAPAADVLYLSSDTLKPVLRRNITFNVVGAPVICRGRVYWIDDPNGMGSNTLLMDLSARRKLMSARPDMSDVRVAMYLDGDPSEGVVLTRVFSSMGVLYGITEELANTRIRERPYRRYLCRLDPDEGAAFTKLTPLSRRIAERGMISGGFYYYIVDEPQENIFDLRPDDGMHEIRYFLYRWKLPAASS